MLQLFRNAFPKSMIKKSGPSLQLRLERILTNSVENL